MGATPASVPTSVRTSGHAFLRLDAHRTSLPGAYQGPFPVIRQDYNHMHYSYFMPWYENLVSLGRVKPAYIPDNVMQDQTHSISQIAYVFLSIKIWKLNNSDY